MSWHFSRALVEAFSEATSSAGARSALSSGSPTPPLFLPSDRTTTFSRLSRFGMTFGHLTDDLGAEVLTWCQAVSRARTSASQARAPELTASVPACGPTWRASWAKFDPDTSSWRTAQPSLLGDSSESSVTWPRSGMTAGGLCWGLPMSAPRISGTGSGLWVPAPCATDGKPITGGNLYVTETGAVRHMRPDGKSSNRGLAASVVMWPTPTVCGNYNRKGASKTSGDGLATAVAKFPTPSTLGINGGSHSRVAAVKRGQEVTEVNGGSLNPTWVEWLMGWPLGWTDLKPLETGRCHSAPLPRGESLQEAEA